MTAYLNPPARQRGMSLIELLVAMTLGMIILGAVGYLFIGSNRTSATQGDLIRMQESARNTMDMTGRALRQAGYKLDMTKKRITALGGVDGGLVTDMPPLSDTLIVRHDPKWMADPTPAPNPNPNMNYGEESDCAGVLVKANNAVDLVTGVAPANDKLVAYRFFIKDNKLYCSNKPDDVNDAGEVVANNIENLQVTYGLRGEDGEKIKEYVTQPVGDQFMEASAVRISVLVRGTTPNLVPDRKQTLKFEGESVTFTDGFLRQVYTSTFTIRNQTR
jgi:type IV pilus assembly protein PilW